jgi:hypothetical protein
MKLKVEGHPNLKRDPTTGVILNTNQSAYQNYLINKTKQSAERNEIESIKKDLDSLKIDISDIKNILLSILEK